MPHVSRGLSSLLYGLHPLISYILVRSQRTPDVILASFPQQYSEGDAVFQCLCSTLRAGWQERMSGIAQQANTTVTGRSTVTADPVGKRISIDNFPIDKLVFGCLGNNSPAHGVPAFKNFLHVMEITGKGPGFVDVALVSVGKDPTAVGAIFDGAEEKVYIGTCDVLANALGIDAIDE